MTLRNASHDEIEPGQANAIQNAGGAGLDGSFLWTSSGWQLTLRELTFDELLRIVETVKQVLQ